ncbi:Zinc finger, BED-type predicted [Ceratobasidium sp. AG-Ba]|nr:Zinc finger, BED-type predicted [Ceratobasidium sp. AG-Ba]
MPGPPLPNSAFQDALERLKEATSKLPMSTPEGSPDGVVWRHFGARPKDIKGSLFRRINQAFTECFLGESCTGMDNVERGSYGMDAVVRFLDECAKSPKISSSDLCIMELKIGQLVDLVYSRIDSLPPDKPVKRKRKRASKAGTAAKRRRKTARIVCNSESDDLEFHPPSDSDSSGDSVNSDASLGAGSMRLPVPTETNPQDNHLNTAVGLSQINEDGNKPDEPKSHEIPFLNHVAAAPPAPGQMRLVKPGPKDNVRQWALANYCPPVAGYRSDTQKPVWIFKCRYCNSIRTFSRPEGSYEFSLENASISASNLSTHLHECPNAPDTIKKSTLSTRSRKRSNITATLAGPSPLSKSKFRSVLIQGVVQDNYPLTFGEGAGMRQVFALLGIELPSHQTLREDLRSLHVVLHKTRVTPLLQAQNCRFAISSDAWTSRSFVFSLGGLVVSFIDQNWDLQEFLLDVVDLNADHAGVNIGRRIFKSLNRAGIASKVIASMTDNASNNQTMNAELSARIKKKLGVVLNVRGMTVTCLCHALHLICSLKAAETIDTDEAYAYIKSFDDDELFEQAAEVLEEEKRLRGELAEDSDVESSDSEDELDCALDIPKSQPTTPANRMLNPVQKVHAIVLHCTSSASRRKRMRAVTRSLNLEPLAVIKGEKMRWNSTYAELKRAKKLKPAFNQYVATLDEGKPSNGQTQARMMKKVLTMADEEWDAIDEVLKILEPFDLATRDFSNRGRTTLHAVLPTYAYLHSVLTESQSRLNFLRGTDMDVFGLLDALAAGKAKLQKYFDMACENDLIILASVLHPGMRVAYFEDTEIWGDTELAKKGRALLEYMYEVYKDESGQQAGNTVNATSYVTISRQPQGFIDRLLNLSGRRDSTVMYEEVLDYIGGRFPYEGGSILIWWRFIFQYSAGLLETSLQYRLQASRLNVSSLVAD